MRWFVQSSVDMKGFLICPNVISPFSAAIDWLLWRR